MTQLSPHFSLAEMIRTSHRTFDNNPPPEVVEQLTKLCVYFLEPIRERFGPVLVGSGYRCPELNHAIGGSRTSAHMYGCAGDFEIEGIPTIEIVDWVVDESGLPFDQVIDEYSSTSNWVHMGILRPQRIPGRTTPRMQALTMRGGKYFPFDRWIING